MVEIDENELMTKQNKKAKKLMHVLSLKGKVILQYLKISLIYILLIYCMFYATAVIR